jgi:tetratricopeptide (TPR) repeat protein
VAARTSCFAFKGRNEDIRKIAQVLNVRAILEGSVREDGQHIRITAQLINASDGYHLWSKTYDRDLSNILQVQDEIAQAITAALTHTLGGGAATSPKPNRPAIDPDAYRDYLKAQALSALKTDEGDAQAVELLKTVTIRAPNFAPAFAALGRTYVHMASFQNQDPDLPKNAKSALERALAIDRRNLEALSTRLYLETSEWDWDTAGTDAVTLQSTNPHNVFALRGLQFYYGSLGFPARQIASLQEITRLDPLSFVDLNNLASVYLDQGENMEAVAAATAALKLKPDRPLALYSLCWGDAAIGNFQAARRLSRNLARLGRFDASDACSLRIAVALDDTGLAARLAEEVANRFPDFFFKEADVGYFYALAKEYPAALRWLNRAYASHDSNLFSLVYSTSTPSELVKGEGWKALMSRPEARAWKKAHDRLAHAFATQ